jgi:NAD(P)-dependent dehydrogenase (short-subunit alcohol dehydrogenase family)
MKDYLGYKEKVCAVTGGSNGMGKRCVELLLEMGAKVYVLDVVKSDNPDVTFIKVNLMEKESIKTAFHQLPQLDRFFAYAGVSGAGGYKGLLAINTLSNMYMMDELLYDKINENGAVMFTSSIAGLGWETRVDEYRYVLEHTWEESSAWIEDDINAWKEKYSKVLIAPYVCSKMILNYYITTHCLDFGKKGIRLNAICPSLTQTRMRDGFVKAIGGNSALLTGAAFGREGTADDMAGAAIMLNSDLASYITGVLLYVDGGWQASKLKK